MSPNLARPLLHTTHVLTFAVLVITGLLLYLPDLRATFVGGYSLLLSRAHCWGGVAFAILPVLIVSRCGLRSVFVRPERWTFRTLWQGAHVAVTVLVSTVLAATGFALWGKRMASRPLVEASLVGHDWMTYAVLGLFGVHLVDVGVSAVVGRFHAVVAVAPERPHP